MVNLKKHVTLGDILLEVVELFHYLGDKIYVEGGCELATTAQTRAASGKFCELLPLQMVSQITRYYVWISNK